MRTLKFPVSSYDQENTFTFSIGHRAPRGYLFKDEAVGTIYVMQSGAMLKGSYTAEDIAERNRLNAETPIREGDLVQVEGKTYRVSKLGDYSDAGTLIPVE